ncbi:MAG: thiol:disulfide interchange protein DsbC [Nitrospirae bacterium]|nr:MAG: thiol:disulfide interchange protein DsbC [Nitrospirota bacterium]
MHILLLLILVLSCQLSAISPVYASGACDADCTKCHTLSTTEVQGILVKIKNPEAKILKIQMSPARGLWEVAVENKGQRGLFYVDFSKKYLIAGPIIEVNAAVDRTKERVDELNKGRRIDRSKIPLKNALLLGDKNAAKKIIVFTDPDCPFCGKFHAELKKVVEQRRDIAFYIKLLPLIKLHPDAYWKSVSVVCEKSLKLLEDNFDKKSIPKTDCKTDEIDKNIKLAERLGITGTPTAIMPDGSVQVGFLEADKLIKMIDSAKKKGTGK